MANSYHDSGRYRAAKVQRLFDTIAPRYDLINDIQSLGLHRLWKKRLIALSGLQQGERVLDLCCGTGDIATALAARGAQVVALDFSLPMIETAMSRSGQPSGSPILFLQGDALCTPFEDNSFDIVTIGYGLRNLADFERGIREMFRVTRPGGRVLILDFGKPEWAPWRWAYFNYLRFIVPIFGRFFCGNAQAYAYILESLRHYPAQQGVADMMARCGFVRTRIIRFLGSVMTINYGQKPAMDGSERNPG